MRKPMAVRYEDMNKGLNKALFCGVASSILVAGLTCLFFGV